MLVQFAESPLVVLSLATGLQTPMLASVPPLACRSLNLGAVLPGRENSWPSEADTGPDRKLICKNLSEIRQLFLLNCQHHIDGTSIVLFIHFEAQPVQVSGSCAVSDDGVKIFISLLPMTRAD